MLDDMLVLSQHSDSNDDEEANISNSFGWIDQSQHSIFINPVPETEKNIQAFFPNKLVDYEIDITCQSQSPTMHQSMDEGYSTHS